MPAQLRPASRLFAVYALLSAVPVVALGVALDRTYRDEARQQGIDRGSEQAAVIEEMAVSPALSGADLTEGLSRGERERLSKATDLAVYSGSVLRLRLRDFDGRVVFSDNGRSDTLEGSTSPAFQHAAAGRTSAEVVATAGGRAVRVLRPVIANASGRSTGVLELYLPYEEIAAAVDTQVRRAWSRLLIGLVLLYAVLAAISWSTSHSLRRHAAQREHEALHDPLTGLPNRALFHERATHACARATRDAPVALVLLDLDRFKHVNDTLGHHAGDELLMLVARRLSAGVRSDDTVARLGGDEFGLVLPGVQDEAGTVALLEQLRCRLAEELQLEGVGLSVEASIGVALVPQHGQDVETLLKRADAAMYRGKRGSGAVVVAEAEVGPTAPHALAVTTEMRRALERDELVLHYQPKIELSTGCIVAVEALARWQHPERGLLMPGEFLPGVERSEVVGPFTTWVLRRALTDLVAWTAAGQRWAVAVNVSARNVETWGFVEEVVSLLAEHDVPTDRVLLEITETALAADAGAVSAAVHDLAARGVAVSVDDFGTGWSSLTQLRSLPVAEVKIDRSFVQHLDADPQDRALVRSVVDLAHGLGCRVTAEGVESQRTADWLTEAGCDEAQGYLWGRPAPWPSLVPHTRERSAPRLRPKTSAAAGTAG
jgi:diguanylate cyclase (GGDEF)-like protein